MIRWIKNPPISRHIRLVDYYICLWITCSLTTLGQLVTARQVKEMGYCKEVRGVGVKETLVNTLMNKTSETSLPGKQFKLLKNECIPDSHSSVLWWYLSIFLAIDRKKIWCSSLIRFWKKIYPFVTPQWRQFFPKLNGSGVLLLSSSSSSSLSLLWNVQTRSREHSISYSMGTDGNFPSDRAAGVWSWPPTLLLILRKGGALPLLPHKPSWCR
jgi:hypothetical protein